jgi:hypothetical protein
MTELVASETTVVIALSAASALAIALTTLIVGVMFFAVFDGERPSTMCNALSSSQKRRARCSQAGLYSTIPTVRPALRSDGSSRRKRRRAERCGSRVRTRLHEQAAADGGLHRF